MKDFLGQDLEVGDFIVYPGGGNGTGSYGMVLHRIIKIDKTKRALRTERLKCNFKIPNDTSGATKDEILRTNATIKLLTMVIKVKPPREMIEVFETAPMTRFDLIARWIGGREIDWNKLEIIKR